MKTLKIVLVSILLVLVAASFAFSQVTKVRVTGSAPNVRVKPQGAIIFKAPLGAVFSVQKKEGAWYLIQLPSENGFERTGYIHQGEVEVVEEIKQAVEKEKRGETKPPEPARKETVRQSNTRVGHPAQISRQEPAKRRLLRAGLGLSFPSGNIAEVFRLGIGLDTSLGYSILNRPGFEIELLGNLEADIFFRRAGYVNVSWTRLLFSGDGRFNFKLDPVTIFVQGGLGVYLDILEVTSWWWTAAGSEFRFGPKIGGGITFGDFEISATYHMVENSMFTIVGSFSKKF